MRKDAVLQYLRGGDEVSGEKLGKELGISRVAVCKIIAALKKDGYQIAAVPHRGYRLLRPELSQQELSALLPENPWHIEVLREVDSTNNALKRRWDAPHGSVLLTAAQTGGRGRLGRSFASPHGGVYLSVLLRPQHPAQKLLHLTPMTAVAVRRAIFDCCGIRADIKWINDLVYGGKKLGGILTELSTEAGSDALQSVIIGIGINCNTAPEELPAQVRPMATSLREVLGENVDPNRLAAAIICRLQEMDAVLFSEKKAWMAEYKAACITIGKPVQLISGTQRTQATALDIDEDGALLVRDQNGACSTVNTGEVSVRGMYGYV